MRTRGFTLVEMLVTMAVMALVGTLLWQALAAVALLENQLARTRSLSNDDLLRRAWVEQALGGVMTGADGDPQRFEGTGQRLRAYTTMPPWPGSLGPELMTLELERTDNGQRLLARRPEAEAAQELWRWEGSAGRFDYLDSSGIWQSSWPHVRAAAALPTAIRLRGPAAGPVLVPVLAMQGPMLRQQDLLPDDARP